MAEKARERAFQRMLEHAAAAGGNGMIKPEQNASFFWDTDMVKFLFFQIEVLTCNWLPLAFLLRTAVVGVQFTGQEIIQV